MQVFSNKLLIELEIILKAIELEQDAGLKRAEASFKACRKSIDQLKVFITKYKFVSEDEEIKFFKEIKPKFTSKLIYHLMLYNIETKKPNGGKEILKHYYTKELQNLKNYFDYNLDFYKYYRAEANYLDHKYFIRNKYDIQLTVDAYIFENDVRFSTAYDYKIAKILAHDLLQVCLEKELVCLEQTTFPEKTKVAPKLKLTWIESKAALIELIYALHTQVAFGSNTDIKEIAHFFETAFNIDLGDYYRTFLELRNRKTGNTKFMDELRNGLQKRMQNQDER